MNYNSTFRHFVLEKNSVSGWLQEILSCCQISPGLYVLHQNQADEEYVGAGQTWAEETEQARWDGDGGWFQLPGQTQLSGLAIPLSQATVQDLVAVQDM